jgi:hypothetical protein
MIILNRDGTLAANGPRERAAEQIKEIIEVPFDLITRQSDLIDRIFAFAFGSLGLTAIEVRILPTAADRHVGLSCVNPCL